MLTIGETPVAVIQSRYRHPSEVQPGMVARLLCRVFHPTSSLATACGLQTLIDLGGPSRVLVARIAGLFSSCGYSQAFDGWREIRLAHRRHHRHHALRPDNVLGPEAPEALCQRAAMELGVAVAIVDANDLGRVKVLASSRGCDEELLQRALRPNPAGNANERTPLVLVRPGIA